MGTFKDRLKGVEFASDFEGPRFDYYVASAMTIKGLQTEISKRAAEGWRVVAAYSGGNSVVEGRHTAILERPAQP